MFCPNLFQHKKKYTNGSNLMNGFFAFGVVVVAVAVVVVVVVVVVQHVLQFFLHFEMKFDRQRRIELNLQKQSSVRVVFSSLMHLKKYRCKAALKKPTKIYRDKAFVDLYALKIV